MPEHGLADLRHAKVLFIVRSNDPDNAPMTRAEEKVETRLGDGEGCLGCQVTVKSEAEVSLLDTLDKALVVISSTVSANIGDKFRHAALPVVVSGEKLYRKMRMFHFKRERDDGPLTTAELFEHRPMLKQSVGSEPQQTRLKLIDRDHPLAAGLRHEIVSISQEQLDLSWIEAFPKTAKRGRLDVLEIATLEKDASKVALFGYRSGGNMCGMKAPAKRVGLPLDYKMGEPSELTPQYWLLFDAAIKWAAGVTGVQQFDEIFKEEWREIQERRVLYNGGEAADKAGNSVTGLDGMHAPENLVGLALSGGGIRSATFCLGLLQELNNLKLLRLFDYLSTVSGGGYVGGWWSAWLARKKCRQEPTDVAHQPQQETERPDIFPDREKIEPERLDDYRWRTMRDKMAEGSLSAGKDPIHHLRLFANYLTPRKGMLSSDTWRAVAVITRNLMLTWLTLLPLLVAFVLTGQFYYLTQTDATRKFFHLVTDAGYAANLLDRALYASYILLPLIGWIGLMYVAYMRSNASLPLLVAAKDWLSGVRRAQRRPESKGPARLAEWLRRVNWTPMAHWVGGIGVFILLFFVAALYQPPPRPGGWVKQVIAWWQVDGRWKWLFAWATGGTILLLYALPWRAPNGESGDLTMQTEWRRGVWRNKIVRVHSRLLVVLALSGAMLAFAGYGHEIFEYLRRAPRQSVLDYVGKIGGWVTFIATIAGTLFTAYKVAPSAGHDRGETDAPSPFAQVVLAITPLLVVIVLMVTAAWVAHELLRHTGKVMKYHWPLDDIAFVGVNICLFFAFFEMRWKEGRNPIVLILLFVVLVVGFRGWIYFFPQWSPVPKDLSYEQRLWLLRLGLMLGSIIVFRLALTEREQRRADEDRFEIVLIGRTLAESRIVLVVLLLCCLALAGLAYWGAGNLPHEQAYSHAATNQITHQRSTLGLGGAVAQAELSISAFAAIIICVFLVVVEMIWGRGKHRRSLILIASVYVLLATLLLVSFLNDYTVQFEVRLIHALVGLLATILAWVVALGWMADPNTLSLHAFYKARIVRAYLGASNPQRGNSAYEIHEAVAGDDVLLRDLQNCQEGGPYHLLNTTLNLVGGRDLTTAQRSSAMFVLSKLHCGSFRTGFRRSANYMDGRLSLGTAVAVSGAAVSPGMGSGKTSASLTMLMTLLNLRLGYWAPTPSGEEWASAQPRLWPFYTIREFLSQTSDLGNYSYLTDGGHFDNLGLYSLVERGCRFIVVADAAADPEPCFSDLGNAIRRCRIDFNADIDLDITPFIKQAKDDRFAKQHAVVGTITYSEEHVEKLGWKPQQKDETGAVFPLSQRTGYIIYIKPSLLKNEKEMRADVRQYEIENSGFPQQSTVDQWFDEAQFESYRRLGASCAQAAFRKLKLDFNQPDQAQKAKSSVRPTSRPRLSRGELKQAVEQASFAARISNSPRLTPKDVEALFKSLFEAQQRTPASSNKGHSALPEGNADASAEQHPHRPA